MSDDDEKSTKFGCQTPWSEPSWYDESLPNPYYTPDHIAFRNKMRDFVETEIIPNVEQWESGNDTIPMETYRKAAQVGLLAATVGYPEGIEGIPPRPQGWDGFMTVISQAPAQPFIARRTQPGRKQSKRRETHICEITRDFEQLFAFSRMSSLAPPAGAPCGVSVGLSGSACRL